MGTENHKELKRTASFDNHHQPTSLVALENHERENVSVTDIVLTEDDNKPFITEEIDQVSPFTLSEQESEELLQMTVEEMERMLQEKFHLNTETDLKDAVILDYFVTVIYWGQQQKYNPQQMCQLFYIVHSLLNKIVDEHICLVDLVKEFNDMITEVVADNNDPAEDVRLFNIRQGKKLVSYLYSSLLQHLKLYQYVFSRIQVDEAVSYQLTVELPVPTENSFPPYLDEGMPENIITECDSLPTPSLVMSVEELKKTFSSDDVILPIELKDIFGKLTQEDVRVIVNEISTEVLSSLQTDTENKMKAQEDNILGKISKIFQEL